MPKVGQIRSWEAVIVTAMLAIGSIPTATNAQSEPTAISPDFVTSIVSDGEVAIPDLSSYDTQTLREIVAQLYRVINHLNSELSQIDQLRADLASLKAENDRLRATNQKSQMPIATHLRDDPSNLNINPLSKKNLPKGNQNKTSIFPSKSRLSNATTTTRNLKNTQWKYSYRPGLINQKSNNVIAMTQEKGHIWTSSFNGEGVASDRVVIMGEFTNLSESTYRYWVVIKVFRESKRGAEAPAANREIGSWPYRTPVLAPNETHRFDATVPTTGPIRSDIPHRIEVEAIPILP